MRARVAHKAERCQFEESPVARPEPLRWARAGIFWSRRLVYERAGPPPLGAPSRFRTGDCVRVKDPTEVRSTLDTGNKTRGLLFTDEQWSYCSGTYRVAKVVRRMLDDQWRMRPISEAVVLTGVTCDGADGAHGCGRSCALIFKDEWLESSSLLPPDQARASLGEARIRSIDEIQATLGADGRLDGMSPPHLAGDLSGTLHKVSRTWDIVIDHPSPFRSEPRARWYILQDVRCDGSVLGPGGPCDRWCPLLWHESWLDVTTATSPTNSGPLGR